MNLEHNIMETRGDNFPDEAVFGVHAALLTNFLSTYYLAVSKEVADFHFSIKESELEQVLKAKINAMGIDFTKAHFAGEDLKGVDLQKFKRTEYMLELKFHTHYQGYTFENTNKNAKSALKFFCQTSNQG